MTDQDIALGISIVAVAAWTWVALLHGLRYPVQAWVMLVVALGSVGASFALQRSLSQVIVVAAFLRAFVAIIGIRSAARLTMERWSRRAGRDDT